MRPAAADGREGGGPGSPSPPDMEPGLNVRWRQGRQSIVTREFHEALLDADTFEDLPGKWQAAILKAETLLVLLHGETLPYRKLVDKPGHRRAANRRPLVKPLDPEGHHR
jgi:hypothetical protein